MEKLCIVCGSCLVGVLAYYVAVALGRSISTAVIFAIMAGLYGAWVGEAFFRKIHH